MLTKPNKRCNWKRRALLQEAEIRNSKRVRRENRALLGGIDALLKLLRAVDLQGRNGTGWEERGWTYIKRLRP